MVIKSRCKACSLRSIGQCNCFGEIYLTSILTYTSEMLGEYKAVPELPEVETVKIGLQKLLPMKEISAVTFDNEKSFPNNIADIDQFVIGAHIVAIKRRAKVLLIELSTQYTLVIHLKMTGQLVYVNASKSPVASHQSLSRINSELNYLNYKSDVRFGAGHPNDSLIGKLPDKSTRVILSFSDLSNLFFNDQRKFGWMRLIPTVEVPYIDFMQRLGPEPLEADFSDKVFNERLQRRKKSRIKPVLLDQTVLAGIGNIYADESLWAAKIHPESRVQNLSKKQVSLLRSELIAVLRLAIEKGGSTDRNYVNAEGKKGSYINFAKVFRKEGSPCARCTSTIVKIRVAGRGTHLCPRCQSEPKAKL